jgi:hypothetical protein
MLHNSIRSRPRGSTVSPTAWLSVSIRLPMQPDGIARYTTKDGHARTAKPFGFRLAPRCLLIGLVSKILHA